MTKIIDELSFSAKTSVDFEAHFRQLKAEVLAVDISSEKSGGGKQGALTKNPVVAELVDAVAVEIQRRVAGTVDAYLEMKGIGGKDIDARLRAAEALEKQVAGLKTAIDEKDKELASLRAENAKAKGELSDKEAMINRLSREMDALISRCLILEERLKQGGGGTPRLSDSERAFLSLLDGPTSFLGISSHEIMEMFNGCKRDIDAFSRTLKRRSQVALHPDKLSPFLAACPDPSLMAFIKDITDKRSQLLEIAVDEIVAQVRSRGTVENAWKFKKLP